MSSSPTRARTSLSSRLLQAIPITLLSDSLTSTQIWCGTWRRPCAPRPHPSALPCGQHSSLYQEMVLSTNSWSSTCRPSWSSLSVPIGMPLDGPDPRASLQLPSGMPFPAPGGGGQRGRGGDCDSCHCYVWSPHLGGADPPAEAVQHRGAGTAPVQVQVPLHNSPDSQPLHFQPHPTSGHLEPPPRPVSWACPTPGDQLHDEFFSTQYLTKFIF